MQQLSHYAHVHLYESTNATMRHGNIAYNFGNMVRTTYDVYPLPGSALTKGISSYHACFFCSVRIQHVLFKSPASARNYSSTYLLGHISTLLVTSPTTHLG